MPGIIPLSASASADTAPIRTAQWRVQLTDSAVPVRIDYLADIHAGTGQALSLTELWHIGGQSLKIISADFAHSDLEEYHYFFKQKTESGFFHSKRKTVETERRSAETHFDSRNTVGVFHFSGGGIDAEISDNDWRDHVPTPDELDGAPIRRRSVRDQPSVAGAAAAPIRVFETVQNTPWCKLSIIFAGLSGNYRPLFVRLIGEEVDEHYFEFFRRSSSRIIHRIDDVDRSGWRSRSYFIDPNAPASAKQQPEK